MHTLKNIFMYGHVYGTVLDRGRFMKNFHFDTIWNITQEPCKNYTARPWQKYGTMLYIVPYFPLSWAGSIEIQLCQWVYQQVVSLLW